MLSNFSATLFLFLTALVSVHSQIAVLGGGNLDPNNTDVYGTFVNLSTPAGGSPYIGIVSAASDDSVGTAQSMIELFQQTYGVQQVEWIPINLTLKYQAQNPLVALKIIKMTGIFFAGGDQERLDECFYTVGNDGLYHDTLVLKAIRTQYKAKKLVISGTSAGSDIQQGIPMVTGGESWDAFVYGVYDHTDSEYPNNLSYDKDGGFDFFTWGLLDTHFGSMGRQGRTMKLLSTLLGQSGIAFGVDENTGIVLQDDMFTVVGQRGVYIIEQVSSNSLDDDFYLFSSGSGNFSFSYITKDDTFSISNKEITFAGWKKDFSSVAAQKEAMTPSTDIFTSPDNVDADGNRLGAYQFMIVALDLFNSTLSNSTYGLTFETNPRLKVNFVKTENSKAMYGQIGNETVLSYTNLLVSVEQDSIYEYEI